MNSSARNGFRKHLSAMLRTDRNFRAEFTSLLLRYDDGDIIEPSKLLVGRMVPFQDIGLIDLLNDQRIKIFIRLMQMTEDRISWSRRLRNVAFLDDTGIDLFRISNATLRTPQFQVFDDLDGAERSMLEQLSTAEIDLISDLTTLGFNVFLTISCLSKKEISFLLSLKPEELDLMIKFGFKNTCLLASHDNNTRNEVLKFYPNGRIDDRLVAEIFKLDEEERIGLGNLIDGRVAIIKDFGIKENMDRVLGNIGQCSEDDLVTLGLGTFRRFDEVETNILKGIPLIVFKLASTLTRTELDEILLLPKGMFRTLSSGESRKSALNIPDGYPLAPKLGHLEWTKETAFRSLDRRQRNVLVRVHKLPPRAVAMLLDLDLARIKIIMTSEVGFNRREKYLNRQLQNLSPQSRHDIVWMTDAEWRSFHSIRTFDGHICDILMNLNGPEIDVLRAMNSLTEKQLDFVSQKSETGSGILATNSKLGHKTINSIMQLQNEEEKIFLLNLDLKTRFSIGKGILNRNMTSDGGQLLKEMIKLNEKEKWWMSHTNFTESFGHLNRHRVKVFDDLFEKIETDEHPIFDVWNGEKPSKFDSKLLANVIIAQRPKNIEFLRDLDFLDPIFFVELLQTSVEAGCDEDLQFDIIQEIRRREFEVRDLVHVYDYSEEHHVRLLRWILINSLKPGQEILHDFARTTLFDSLYGKNNLTFEQIFHPTSAEVIPALHKQFVIEGYHLAKALFFVLSDSTRLFEILNPLDCSILIESNVSNTHTMPNLEGKLHTFQKSEIKFLKASSSFNRGDVVPMLEKLPNRRLVAYFDTDSGHDFLHSSLRNGRINLLRFLRQRLTNGEMKSIIRKADYSIVHAPLKFLDSVEHAQYSAMILHELLEMDPDIPKSLYIERCSEIVSAVQEIAPREITISIIRSLITVPIKLDDLIGPLSPEIRSVLSHQVTNGCNDSSIPCIDSRDIREIPSGAKDISNKLRTSAIMSLIASRNFSIPKTDPFYLTSEIAEKVRSKFERVSKRSIARFLASGGPVDLNISGNFIFLGTNRLFVDIDTDDQAIMMVLDFSRRYMLLEREDPRVYWSMFWNNQRASVIEVDAASSVLEQFVSRVVDIFAADYDSIGLSLPRWIMGWEEYYLCPLECILRSQLLPGKLVFDRKAVARNPYEQNKTLLDSSFLPERLRDYNFVCGPSSSHLDIEIHQSSGGVSTGRYRLPGNVDDRCQNFAMYEKDEKTRSKGMLYIAQDYFEWESSQSSSIDLIFLGREINFIDSGINKATNHFMLKGDLTTCKIHKKGLNFFYTHKNEFSCDLDITQGNVAVVHEDFEDSKFLNSVLGGGNRNKITISYASFVDGGGGNDEIIAPHLTIVRAHYGDLIIGNATVLLPGSIEQIQRITIEPTTFVFWYKTSARIEVDKNCKLVSRNDYFFVPIQEHVESNRIHRISLRKTLGVPIDTTELREMGNDNFEFIKYFSSPGLINIITEMNDNVFITDHDDHHYYWEAPPGSRNLYIFTKSNSIVTISQANGVLDFTSFNTTLEDIALRKTNGGFTLDHENLHVILLTNYNEIRMTFDGEKYYKLHSHGLERDYCSHPMKMRGRISIQSPEFMYHNNCFEVRSDKVYFFRSNDHLILVCNTGTTYLDHYYSFIHNKLDLSLQMNSYTMEPAEVWRRASNPSSIKYYEVDKQGSQIYHNQPDNKYDVGLVDLGDWTLTKCNITFSDDDLSIVLGVDSSLTVKNWKTHPSTREMVFHFKDDLVLNTECIVSNCNSDDVLQEIKTIKSQGSRSRRETNNFGFVLLVFQNWLDRKYPLPVQRCDAREEIFADAYKLAETFENALNKTAEEFHTSLDGFNIFNVYQNISRLVRAEKYSLILEDFRKIAETFGLDGDILLDRFFEIIKENC